MNRRALATILLLLMFGVFWMGAKTPQVDGPLAPTWTPGIVTVTPHTTLYPTPGSYPPPDVDPPVYLPVIIGNEPTPDPYP